MQEEGWHPVVDVGCRGMLSPAGSAARSPDLFLDFRRWSYWWVCMQNHATNPWLPRTSLLETVAASRQQLLHRNRAGPHHGSFGMATLRSSDGAPEGRRSVCCGHPQRRTRCQPCQAPNISKLATSAITADVDSC
ncbi:unnamed protein product [Symbiodinium natans]|uniref:Uncharacterized protein n=1 Tax=Symbiodinium natans TaxID=878477 RepID=A0A812TYF6_9DINO|nr:unnamed protein product [Symbiodinium natans]